MSDGLESNNTASDEIVRNRYLDILHQFTLRQSSLIKLEDIVWNIAAAGSAFAFLLLVD